MSDPTVLTRSEWVKLRQQVQADIADRTVAENLRHSKELGILSRDLRERLSTLDNDFIAAGGRIERR